MYTFLVSIYLYTYVPHGSLIKLLFRLFVVSFLFHARASLQGYEAPYRRNSFGSLDFSPRRIMPRVSSRLDYVVMVLFDASI
jgi:hypothetical protein